VVERYGEPWNPVLSPDGTMLAGVVGGEFSPHTAAYVVVDLTGQTGTPVHTVLPVPTDAGIPWGIHWSPSGEWLALAPPSWDPLEGGVWLVRADGTEKRSLGPGTGHPVWIEAGRLIFTATVDGETQTQMYDLATGERVRLDLPAGAEPVQYIRTLPSTPAPSDPYHLESVGLRIPDLYLSAE